MSALGTPGERLAKLARHPRPGVRLTYRGGRDGLGDPDAILTDCPGCGQAVRVELHGDRLSGQCYGGCEPDRLHAALATARIAAELRGAS